MQRPLFHARRDRRDGTAQARGAPRATVRAPAGWQAQGFCAGTPIDTAMGPLPVEALRLHDLIRTLSGDLVPITWIDTLRLDVDFLRRHPESVPLRLAEGGLAPNRPARALTLSPGQQIAAEAPDSGDAEGFHARPAASIGAFCAVDFAATESWRYFRFHCSRPIWIEVAGLSVLLVPPPSATERDDGEDAAALDRNSSPFRSVRRPDLQRDGHG